MNFETDYRMLIDGALVDSHERLDVVNPATGAAFATAPDCTDAQLAAAVDAGRRAFKGWRGTPIADRQAYLHKAADILNDHREQLARLFTREQGRPTEAAKSEIDIAVAWLHAYAEMTPPVDVIDKGDGQRVETHYVPLGVVCAISPWNFPVNLSFWKIAPALAAGNTIVLKPSPYTPLCMLKIGELLKDVFPAGVLNIITGSDALGPKMTAHPGFAKISFTGSTATGKRVMESASKDLKRLTLELGGNDAAIVMPDVDLDDVAQKIFFGAFFNSAQICVATKRLYVHESIYDGLRDRLAGIAQAVKLGDGSEQGTVLGPLQNRRQYDRVTSLIEDAKAEGLTLIEGPAGPAGGGYFIPVTIVDNPPEQSAVVQEEAFGPVLPMMKFSTVEEVIDRANASEYGLAGAVWSKDVDQAVAIARQLETGTVWINQNLVLRPDTPFAGHKQSGFGIENGLEGMLEYMAPQSLYIPQSAG
ncbi:acyl-CoA reductase-like NAD-dependent aldehyde dehydrogenase [Sphingopyxis panaciterrae]|uniref:aldehyde dehydrogenase family protein n=1 Tax=Sphingopyxis panaciterrae TaxID=363841 RepID=UPI0014243EC7|nr:aldehyde dehydrogenase family protein [Sphingopyxis panaciterrae]NIJ36110.1 acyl-CoA reductase-like NAD-dependent aldehyde dehydrogenase [Sphingopyxis panaciterrae]